MRTRNQYPAWIKQQIESLAPNQYFIIPSHITPTLDEINFRTMISSVNRRFNLHLKVHRDSSVNPPQWWVWYCPDPKPIPKPNPRPQLLDSRIQSLHSQLQTALSQDDMVSAMAINSELETLKESIQHPAKPYKKLYPSKGSITFPLDTILRHLNLSRSEWENMDATKRLRLRIRTELAIKFSIPTSSK